MKERLAIFLTILFISFGCRDVLTIVYFYGNQTYIIENFCVNRKKPEKQCNGKCYLSKQLEEERDEDVPLNHLVYQFKLKIAFSDYLSLGILDVEAIHNKLIEAFDSPLYHSDYFFKILQPPEVPSGISC